MTTEPLTPDLDAIESRAAWAGSYSTDGVQAAAERLRIARVDVPALIARVRAAEAEREALREAASDAMLNLPGNGTEETAYGILFDALASYPAATTPAHCPSCDGYQSAVMNDGRRSVGVCEGVASRTVETAEEWEYGVDWGDGDTVMHVNTPLHQIETMLRAVRGPATERAHPVRRKVGPWEPVPPTPEEAAYP